MCVFVCCCSFVGWFMPSSRQDHSFIILFRFSSLFIFFLVWLLWLLFMFVFLLWTVFVSLPILHFLLFIIIVIIKFFFMSYLRLSPTQSLIQSRCGVLLLLFLLIIFFLLYIMIDLCLWCVVVLYCVVSQSNGHVTPV